MQLNEVTSFLLPGSLFHCDLIYSFGTFSPSYSFCGIPLSLCLCGRSLKLYTSKAWSISLAAATAFFSLQISVPGFCSDCFGAVASLGVALSRALSLKALLSAWCLQCAETCAGPVSAMSRDLWQHSVMPAPSVRMPIPVVIQMNSLSSFGSPTQCSVVPRIESVERVCATSRKRKYRCCTGTGSGMPTSCDACLRAFSLLVSFQELAKKGIGVKKPKKFPDGPPHRGRPYDPSPDDIFREVVINDCDARVRYQLTRMGTHEDVCPLPAPCTL